MTKELDKIIRIMGQTHGRDISLYDDSFLVKSIDRRLADTGIRNIGNYSRALSENSTEAELFFRSLNIRYSEFFRNPLTFALLEQLILPGLAAKKEKSGRQEIRIWSAACAAGQEAYSIAILLDEMAAAGPSSVPFRIFATDISEKDLLTGRTGAFDSAAVQNVRMKYLRHYFTKNGETYTLVPALRNRVDFSAYDLLEETSSCPPISIFGDFDLVICSNLLFYYRPDVRHRILDKVYNSMSPGGYLVTGEAERDIVVRLEGLRAVAPFAAVFQKN